MRAVAASDSISVRTAERVSRARSQTSTTASTLVCACVIRTADTCHVLHISHISTVRGNTQLSIYLSRRMCMQLSLLMHVYHSQIEPTPLSIGGPRE
jgi:hypothetical protein